MDRPRDGSQQHLRPQQRGWAERLRGFGELANQASHHNTWTGNIAITDGGNPAISNISFGGDGANKNVTWSNNTTFNGTKGADAVSPLDGNSLPSDANNNLGTDPGLSLSEIRAKGAALTGHTPPLRRPLPTPPRPRPRPIWSWTAAPAPPTSSPAEAGDDKLTGGAGDDQPHRQSRRRQARPAEPATTT